MLLTGGAARAPVQVQAAEDVLLQSLSIRMSAEGFAAFVDALEQPDRPVPEMVDVLVREAPWEKAQGSER